MQPRIPLSVPNLSSEEMAFVTTAIETEWVSTGGPYVSSFEHQTARYLGVPDAVACQSGTAGLHLAYMEAGVRADDLVILPDLTFIASVNPVRYIGAWPVLIDCGDDLCLDADKLLDFCEQACALKDGALWHKESGKRVRAVVPVHIFGNLADMERIVEIADAFSLVVIEDACEAIGSKWIAGKYAGCYAGTVGEYGVFSFNGNKIITTGGGGMVIAKDPDKLRHIRYLSQQSKDDALRFVHNEIGYNYRLTNLQAALGMAQIEKLDTFIEIKKQNYHLYREQGIDLYPFSDNVAPNYWFYSYLTDRRDELMRELSARGIETRPPWELMHRLPPYRGAVTHQIEKAPYYHEKILNLPCSTNLTPEQVARVAREIHALKG